MVAIYAVVSVLLVFALSLLVVRVGAVALEMTGLSTDVASFQAVSAFSGAGFTTSEAEGVIATPERRRIIKALIRLGSLGIVTAIASLVLSFAGEGGGSDASRLTILVVGAGSIVVLARSRWLNRLVTPVVRWGLARSTALDLRDYTQLLRLGRGYRVAEIAVEEDDWLADKPLRNLDLSAEGVIVLGIVRPDGSYLGVPGGDRTLYPGDTLLAYGRERRLKELSERERGDRDAHEAAVEAHRQETDAADVPSYS